MRALLKLKSSTGGQEKKQYMSATNAVTQTFTLPIDYERMYKIHLQL
jgi:hypothetical protein